MGPQIEMCGTAEMQPAGKSLEETKKSVDLSKYKDWGGHEQMGQLNIEGVYRLVQANRRGN